MQYLPFLCLPLLCVFGLAKLWLRGMSVGGLRGTIFIDPHCITVDWCSDFYYIEEKESVSG